VTTGRQSVLLVAYDPYVLRACEIHDIDPVLLCNPAAYDGGRVQMPERGVLIRVDDVTNPEDCLGALHRAGLGDMRFDGIQTTWEFSLVTVAVLGAALGCRTLDPVTALNFRDKSLQKGKLRSAGIPVAKTVVIDDINDVSGVPFEFDRAVLKPIAGAGTTSTSMVRDRKELEDKSRYCREQKVTGRTFLLEEFIDGDELMADGVVFDGEVLFYGLGVYTQPCLEAVSGQVPISLRRVDPVSDAEAYEQTGPVVRGAISALGLRDGVFHMELFREHGTGRIFFSECAARRGGALIQEQVHAKFNVDLGEAALLCAMGRRPDIDVKIHPKTVGVVGLYGPEGTLVGCPTPGEIMTQPNVAFTEMWVPLGATLRSKFSTTVDMLCAMLLITESVSEFDERVAQLREWFDERLIVIEPGLTNGQRRAWQRKHWPDLDYRRWLYDGE
jgi:biotin carboxylase